MPSFSCTVEQGIAAGLRLDRYAADYLKIMSRSQIKPRNLEAHLNGRPVKISRILKEGDRLELSWKEAAPVFLLPEKLPLDVLYEDDRVIVLNKAQGMVVHPGSGNRQGTLANALLYRRIIKFSSEINGEYAFDSADGNFAASGTRPGIVHRLDKDTSGVIIAAWDEEAHAFLSTQFKERTVKKTYAALVKGRPRDSEGCIDTLIARSRRDRKTFAVSEKEGRRSVTRYKLVRSCGNYSLLLIRPSTGRTHQIRVHLKYLGNPILGDPIYGFVDRQFANLTLMLHAKRLSLVLPGDSVPKTFRTHLPERFINFMRTGRER